MSMSLIIVMLNNVTLNVALPELSKDLKADNTELQWILDAYALVFGGLLLVMGSLGDRFGRKGALQIGLLLVATASALTATYATTSGEVIAARAVMGIGAALVMPATLSVVVVVFPPEERVKQSEFGLLWPESELQLDCLLVDGLLRIMTGKWSSGSMSQLLLWRYFLVWFWSLNPKIIKSAL